MRTMIRSAKSVLALSLCIIAGIAIWNAEVFGQQVREVPLPQTSPQQMDSIHKILFPETDAGGSVTPANKTGFLESTFRETHNDYQKYSALFTLSFHYGEQQQYGKLLHLLQDGQKQGLFLPFMTGQRTWPGYLEELAKLDGYDELIQRNEELREEAQKGAVAEYMVQLPAGYTAEKSYPLLMVFHGGVGSHLNSYYYWQSPKLQANYIVAYLQGHKVRGSYARSFDENWTAVAQKTYREIVGKYAVDTTRVLLGGQSAGGRQSVVLAMENSIPVSGLILAFPVKPLELDTTRVRAAARRGMRAAILTGENDHRFLKGQKEMAVIFDRMGLPNRFVVFPFIGHEFPADFSRQIGVSLDFIEKTG